MKNKVYVNTNTTDYYSKTGRITEYEAENTNNIKSFFNALQSCIQLSPVFKDREAAFNRAWVEHAVTHRKCYEPSHSENRLFCDTKSMMENDIFFPVLKVMPKGSLFHVHGAAGLSFEGLVALCIGWNAIKPLNELAIEVVLETIPDKIEKYTLMYHYQVEAARKRENNLVTRRFDEFINEPGNKEALKAAICFLDGSIKTKDVWKKFNHSYARFNSLFRNGSFYHDYFRRFAAECNADHIQNVDVRIGFEEFDDITKNALYSSEHNLRYSEGFSLDRYLYFKDLAVTVPQAADAEEKQIAFLNQILAAFKDTGCDFKIILTANRNIDIGNPGNQTRLERKVDLAIAIKEGALPETIPNKDKLKELIVGFDFVNQEDHGYSTDAYLPIIYGNGEGTNIPRIQSIDFYLHDGESCWKMAPNMKLPKYASVIEACAVSKYRIGHGLTMAQFPELVAAIQNGVGPSEQMLPADPEEPFLLLPILEINPISNQLLKYYPDLRLHPMPQLMKSGINCVLSNDDPLILDNPGLSYDFWISIMDMELTYEMVKKLVFTTYAFTEIRKGWVEEKEALQTAHSLFAAKWGEFLNSEAVTAFINAYAQK